MPYVTDTHSLIWHMTDDPELSVEAKKIFTQLEGQGLREFIITFWHEMVEIATINGASQAITLSHAGIEATAVALADLYGAPTFRVLNLVLEALGL